VTSDYDELFSRIRHLLEGEDDWVSAMATVACELHHSDDRFHWTGFYRVVSERMLAIGPYQGSHGCLRISFDRGVCGAAARTGETQLVEDVHAFEGHIACSATTQSEIVVPVKDEEGEVFAVLDIDSDLPAAFDERDQEGLERICGWLGERYGR
jgi:L-methionine (R)-S-oxide reductase